MDGTALLSNMYKVTVFTQFSSLPSLRITTIPFNFIIFLSKHVAHPTDSAQSIQWNSQAPPCPSSSSTTSFTSVPPPTLQQIPTAVSLPTAPFSLQLREHVYKLAKCGGDSNPRAFQTITIPCFLPSLFDVLFVHFPTVTTAEMVPGFMRPKKHASSRPKGMSLQGPPSCDVRRLRLSEHLWDWCSFSIFDSNAEGAMIRYAFANTAKFVAELVVVLRLDGRKPVHRQTQLKIFVTTLILNSNNQTRIFTPNMPLIKNGMRGYLGQETYDNLIQFGHSKLN